MEEFRSRMVAAVFRVGLGLGLELELEEKLDE